MKNSGAADRFRKPSKKEPHFLYAEGWRDEGIAHSATQGIWHVCICASVSMYVSNL